MKTIMTNFRIISHQLFDIVQEIKNDSFKGFDNSLKRSKEYVFDNGKIIAAYNEEYSELNIEIFDGIYAEDSIVDIGIPIEKIESEKTLADSIIFELQLSINHFTKMINELE